MLTHTGNEGISTIGANQILDWRGNNNSDYITVRIDVDKNSEEFVIVQCNGRAFDIGPGSYLHLPTNCKGVIISIFVPDILQIAS